MSPIDGGNGIALEENRLKYWHLVSLARAGSTFRLKRNKTSELGYDSIEIHFTPSSDQPKSFFRPFASIRMHLRSPGDGRGPSPHISNRKMCFFAVEASSEHPRDERVRRRIDRAQSPHISLSYVRKTHTFHPVCFLFPYICMSLACIAFEFARNSLE